MKKDNTGSKQVDGVVEAAGKVNIVLKDNPKYTFGKDPTGQKEFEQAIADLKDSHGTFLDKDADRTTAKNGRQSQLSALRSLITLARSGIRSDFGPDSTEYQLSGCKKTSDRKKPRRNGNGNGNGNGQPHA